MASLKGSYRKKNDLAYLDPAVYAEPKEYFKLLVRIIQDNYGQKPISLIDVGCASGAFIHYAKANLNIVDCAGTDVSEELIHTAKQQLPDVEFYINSINAPEMNFEQKFDICVCLGTLCIFDEIERPLRNLLNLIKSGGSLFIFDAFNEEPVDMIMRYRVVGDNEDDQWGSGLNVPSMVTMERLFKKYNRDIEIEWVDFEMPFHIPKRDDSPMRQWTIETKQRKHQVVVGTGQFLNQKIVQARIKK